MQETRQKFRQSIESSDLVHVPITFDGISTRVVEDVGFDAAMMGGAAITNSRLGMAELGFLDLTENLEQTRRVVDAVNIPIIADADTGFGNALNTYHTTKCFERAGVAGIMIEDQEDPKRCGHMSGKSVIPMEDMCRKIRAAVKARTDEDLAIIARTDADATHDTEEAIRRLNAYEDEGADIVFADALLSEESIETVAKNTESPTMVNMGYGIRERPTTPLLSSKELEDLGVEVIAYGRLSSGAAVQGMYNAFEALKESINSGETINKPDLSVGFEEYTELMGFNDLKDLENELAE